MNYGRLGCLIFFLLSLVSACTNLSAVRDFAKTSRAITASEPVISGWAHVYDTANILAASPQMKACGLQSALKTEAKGANADVPLALEASKTLGLYMNVLAALADHKLPDVTDQASSISSSLNTLTVIDNNAKNATAGLIKLISISLDAWRQLAIHDLIIQSNNDVQTMANFLAVTANAIQKADKFAAHVTDQYWEATGGLSKDPGVQALLLRAERQDDRSYATRIAQAAAARTAFEKIAADHEILAMHADSLSSAEVRNALSNDAPVLLSALGIFERE